MFAMETTTGYWVIGILTFGLGVTTGCIATWLVSSGKDRTRELQAELDELMENFRDYRTQVGEHFMHTSELVQEMTRSYRAVYEHLASGAQRLCGEETELPRVTRQQSDQLPDDIESADTDDIIADLAERADYLEQLLGESPRISDLDATREETEQQQVQH